MHESMLTGILLVFLLVTAVFAVATRYVLHAVLSLSIFGILLSVLFVMYQAPDVAMAEAVVGAGLMTALFVVTISKTTNRDDSA